MRVRGLKQGGSTTTAHENGSHPMRVRGLKHVTNVRVTLPPYVAPHAGAWIETTHVLLVVQGGCVAPHAGAWIETLSA